MSWDMKNICTQKLQRIISFYSWELLQFRISIIHQKKRKIKRRKNNNIYDEQLS